MLLIAKVGAIAVAVIVSATIALQSTLRASLPTAGDYVMVLVAGPDGRYEWDGPFRVDATTEDGRLAISRKGSELTVDFPEAIPLDEYRRIHNDAH